MPKEHEPRRVMPLSPTSPAPTNQPRSDKLRASQTNTTLSVSQPSILLPHRYLYAAIALVHSGATFPKA